MNDLLAFFRIKKQKEYLYIWHQNRNLRLLLLKANAYSVRNFFHAWKLALVNRLSVDFQRYIFRRWWNFLEQNREKKSEIKADLHLQKCKKAQQHLIFRKWHLFFDKRKTLSRSLDHILKVINHNNLKGTLLSWIDKHQNIGKMLNVANISSRISVFRGSFSVWRRVLTQIRNQKHYLAFNQKSLESKGLYLIL